MNEQPVKNRAMSALNPPLHVIVWKWQQYKHRDTYTAEHVNVMGKMIRENLVDIPHRVLCITDEPYGVDAPIKTHELWSDHNDLPNVTGRHLPSCYRRLKLFDAETQTKLGIKPGERIISIDLDTIILAPLNEIINRIDIANADYTGWARRGTYHALVFNGSFFSMRAGSHLQWVWSNFNPKVSPRETLAAGYLGSDQGWLSKCFAKYTSICPIRFPDFASYPQEVRRTGVLDRRTRVVFFHGARKPWHVMECRQSPWIMKHWRPPL